LFRNSLHRKRTGQGREDSKRKKGKTGEKEGALRKRGGSRSLAKTQHERRPGKNLSTQLGKGVCLWSSVRVGVTEKRGRLLAPYGQKEGVYSRPSTQKAEQLVDPRMKTSGMGLSRGGGGGNVVPGQAQSKKEEGDKLQQREGAKTQGRNGLTGLGGIQVG